VTDGPIEVGIRGVPELDLAAPLPASDPDLTERIRSEIRVRGPMTFARFMELALYDTRAGYYTGHRPPSWRRLGPGRDADFLTAPESHEIFGWAIAGFHEAVWERLGRPARFVVREHGAGSGALGLSLLDGLRRSGSPLFEAVRYQPIERAQRRIDEIESRFTASGMIDRLETADDAPVEGVVLANELLDAFPVHIVEGAAPGDPRGPILERYVAFDPAGWFDAELGPPSTPVLRERLALEQVSLAPAQAAAICLAVDDWVADASRSLGRGAVLVIDYGADAADLYAPGRGTTLRAYHGHRVHADPFVAVGRQDLTAHVDLTAVERAAVAAGLEPLGRTTQARFLASLGLGELLVSLQSDPATTLETYLGAKSAVVRMLDSRATGGFAVLAFGRGIATSPPLRGFDPAAAGLGAPPDPNR
jgi:SAM-dependent MidA family methyltransferase